MSVDFLNLKKQYDTIDIPKLMVDIEEIITNGSFVGGKHLDNFEQNFAEYNGTEYAVGVGSGTDALIFALKGLNIGPGDEVLVPSNTFIASALAVSHVGATPIFIDVDSTTYLISGDFSGYITPRTKAIMPVHLYGNSVYMPDIIKTAKKFDLYVIEDCAQAIGAEIDGRKVGAWGDVGCFSFYPAKNLGGLGQGGALITNNVSIVNKARSLSNVGRKEGSWYEYDEIGYNSRLDSINALFLNTCLKHIDDWNSRRKAVAHSYNAKLRNFLKVSCPIIQEGCDHVYHLYELKFKDKETRDGVQKYLKEHDIFSALHYPIPCHKQIVYNTMDHIFNLKTTEVLADTLLSLPMHPFMAEEEIEEVCSCIREYIIKR